MSEKKTDDCIRFLHTETINKIKTITMRTLDCGLYQIKYKNKYILYC